jgi:glycosyltransferase involved in cell wall biosynthesis
VVCHIAATRDDIDLSVIRVGADAARQGVGFGRAFTWDTDLFAECSRVLRAAEGRRLRRQFRGIDAAGIITHSRRPSRRRVVRLASRCSCVVVAMPPHGYPILYRGDTHLQTPAATWTWPGRALKTRVLLQQFAAHLAVGRRSREFLLAHGVRATELYHCPHVVDNAFFADGAEPFRRSAARLRARADLGLGGDDFVVLFAGKLQSQKRPIDAVRAVARLGSGAALLVVGDGELAAECRAKPSAPALAPLSRLANQRRWRGHAVADCLVLPSAANRGARRQRGDGDRTAGGLRRRRMRADLVIDGVTGHTVPVGTAMRSPRRSIASAPRAERRLRRQLPGAS